MLSRIFDLRPYWLLKKKVKRNNSVNGRSYLRRMDAWHNAALPWAIIHCVTFKWPSSCESGVRGLVYIIPTKYRRFLVRRVLPRSLTWLTLSKWKRKSRTCHISRDHSFYRLIVNCSRALISPPQAACLITWNLTRAYENLVDQLSRVHRTSFLNSSTWLHISENPFTASTFAL